MSSSGAQVPSVVDLLREGGLYPVPLPLGWKLVGEQGEDVPIPAVPGDPFHRILARGALLATELQPSQPAEAMMLRQCVLAGPPSETTLEQYAELVLDSLVQQGLGPRVVDKHVFSCALSQQPCAKLVIERGS